VNLCAFESSWQEFVPYPLILNLRRLGTLRTFVFFAVVQPMMILGFYNFSVVAVAAGRQEEKEQESV
jgi:hypothetical protein